MMDNILYQIPGYTGWKDSNLRYLGCNANFAQAMQLSHVDKIIDLSDADLPGTEVDYYFHKNNDELVLAGQTVKALHKSDSSLFSLVKQPLLDADKNVCGVIFHCQEVMANDFLTHIYHTDKKYKPQAVNYRIGSSNTRNLSEREMECLFYLLRGMSARAIAECLQLSKRTVETYIENIKNKFGCDTKAILLVQAVTEGYMDIIPEQF